MKYNIIKAALLGAALLFVNCTENKTPPLGELNKNFANRTTLNAFLVYKDSGKVTFELKAPIVEEFTLIDTPYTIMRKGIQIKFWDNKKKEPNFLYADWAKMNNAKNLYEGKGNVRLINYDGDSLFTEHIFWDKWNRKIFTKDTVIIKRLDGNINISNNGMEASEDFKKFTFFNNHGIYIFDESKSKSSSNSNKIEKINTNKVESEKEKMIPIPIEN